MTVKRSLRDMLVDMVQKGELKLPSEPELTQKFKVSRETVRAAITALQKEGMLSRLHGKGTFINYGAAVQHGNLTEGKPFLTVIEEGGFEATSHAVDMGYMGTGADDPIRDLFRMYLLKDDYGDGNFRIIKRNFYGDGVPIALAVDFISPHFLTEPSVSQGSPGIEPGTSIYEFARLNMGETIAYSVAEILPTTSSPYLASELNIAMNSSVLLLKHAHYFQLLQQPVAVTCAFVNTNLITMSVVRSGYEV